MAEDLMGQAAELDDEAEPGTVPALAAYYVARAQVWATLAVARAQR